MISVKKKLALAGSALALGLIASTASAALIRVQPGSGHPANNAPRSDFTIFDNKEVKVLAGPRTWITHAQLPSGVTSVRAIITGGQQWDVSSVTHRLCTYDEQGWTGCTTYYSGGGRKTTAWRTLDATYGTAHVQTIMNNNGLVRHVNFEY